MGKGHDPGRDRSAGAARRSAGGVVKVPGVARGAAIDRGFRGRADAAFGARRAPPCDNAGCSDTVKDRAVAVVSGIRKQPRAVMRGEVHRLGPEVLQKEGDAGERATRQSLRDGVPGHVFLCQHHGVDLRVHLCRCGECGIKQFSGRNLCLRHKRRKVGRIVRPETIQHVAPIAMI